MLFSDAWAVLRQSVNPVECQHIIDFWDGVTLQYPNITFQQAINNIPEFYQGEKVNNRWSAWVIVVFHEQLEDPVKRAFAERIDSVIVLARIFLRLRDSLSSAEKTYLRNRFEPYLPRIKQEIIDGIV